MLAWLKNWITIIPIPDSPVAEIKYIPPVIPICTVPANDVEHQGPEIRIHYSR